MRESLLAFIKSVQEEVLNGTNFGHFGFEVEHPEKNVSICFGRQDQDPHTVLVVYESGSEDWDSESTTPEAAVDILLQITPSPA